MNKQVDKTTVSGIMISLNHDDDAWVVGVRDQVATSNINDNLLFLTALE